jgi:hypothetical protein
VLDVKADDKKQCSQVWLPRIRANFPNWLSKRLAIGERSVLVWFLMMSDDMHTDRPSIYHRQTDTLIGELSMSDLLR